MRKARQITDSSEIEYLLNLTEEECFKTSFIMEMFGEFDKNPKYHPYDTITIPPNSYGPEGKRNKNKFNTTVGIWIFNKAFIEKDLFVVFKYINKSIDGKMIKKINNAISTAVLEDKIELRVLKDYIKKCNKYMPYVTVLSPSYTMKMLTITKDIEAKKKELFKKYQAELDAGNNHVISKIEDELLDYSKELLKDDPSMDMWKSGVLGSLGNNFKNMFVMKGLIKDPDSNKGYNIVKSSYMDGVKAEDYSKLANSLAAGPYARAKKTELGGYWEKLLLVAFQHLTIKSQDCHTKRTIEVLLTEDNLSENMYNFIVDNGRLVELTSDNASKYIGTKVKMRFSSLCEQKDGFCQTCVGNLFKRIDIKNVGVAMPQIASKLKNISMKSFHDSQVNTAKIDYMDAFGLKED